MKKILIVLIALGLVWFFFLRDSKVSLDTGSPGKASETFRPDPSNASFIFDDETVVLSKGKSSSNAGDETSILEEEAYGDLNNDGKDDAAVLLARSGGGSGVFIYVGAYVSGPVNYKGTNAIFLGDRIAPENISISNGVITITYLDRREDEPFAAEPTISRSMELVYRNGTLEER